MERLTTNKDVSEMGMFELAHNSCYCKEGAARYRDFENDIDARELTRHLLKDYADGDDAFVDEDDFDEEMLELLQYGTGTIEGLIALFYRNLWAMADLRERLKEYEDLEEQGLLLRVPCKVGDIIWDNDFGKPCAYRITGFSFGEADGYIDVPVITDDIVYYYSNYNGSIMGSFAMNEIGKSLFLTQAEAEQKLKEMESD